jgi:hypothetical protein
MPDENSSQGVPAEPNKQSSIQAPAQSIRQQDPPTQKAGSNPNQNQNDLQEQQKEIRKAEHWLIGIGILTICVNTLIFLVYYGQLKQMRRSTDAASRAAYASCMATEFSRRTLVETMGGEKLTEQAARASSNQAQAAIASEAPELEATMGGIPLQPNHALRCKYTITNVGKTGAYHLNIQMRSVIIGPQSDPVFTYPKNQTGGVSNSSLAAGHHIPPNDDMTNSVRNPDGTERIGTNKDFEDINAGRQDFMFYGKATLTDVFGVHHWMTFCSWYHQYPVDQLVNAGHPRCAEYNQRDTQAVSEETTTKPPAATPPEIPCSPPQIPTQSPWWKIWE